MSKARLNPRGRIELINILVDLLEDEYKLSKDSDSYQRTSFTSTTTDSTSFSSTRTSTRTSARSFITTLDRNDSIDTVSVSASAMARSKQPSITQTTAKKRSSPQTSAQVRLPKDFSIAKLTHHQTTKRPKIEPKQNQLTLSQTERRRSARISTGQPEQNRNPSRTSPRSLLREPLPVQSSNSLERSFDTVVSDSADIVFSDHEQEVASSNNTSILSDGGEPSGRGSIFSGGTQLDRAYFEDPALNRSFNDAVQNNASQSRRVQLNKLSEENPMLKVDHRRADTENYWLAFELDRLSRYLKCDIDVLYASFLEGHALKPLDKLWNMTKEICERTSMQVPPKSSFKSSSWVLEDDKYISPDLNVSTYFSAKLDFSDKKGQLFDLTLNPIETDRSCRFHRKFGADRFMVLDIPCNAPQFHKDTPAELRESVKPEDIHNKVIDWLGQSELYIAGRRWRAFFIEPKDVTKKKRKEEGTRSKVHLFAVDGVGFTKTTTSTATTSHCPISLCELIQWHTPLIANQKSTDLKLFARIHLGLSKTTPSIVLEQSEFIHVADKTPTVKNRKFPLPDEIMTDGNARISYPLAQAIWRQIGNPKDNVPSVFQARIGGAKGTWTVDYDRNYPDLSPRGFWIEVSDSQLKIKPHPREIEDADECQRTFEVVKYSHVCTPANLNIQLITILSHGGVDRKVIANLLLASLLEYYQELIKSLNDPTALRVWRHAYHASRSLIAEISWCGELPDSKEDELDMLLESGFHPQENTYVKECVHHLLKQVFRDQKEKLWIKVPFSTNTFCIPDPLGVLDEGEVQFNFSQPVSDFPDWELEGRTVLVARNPAHLESDIQAVKYVYKPELRHIKDVIIMPVKGSRSLAGMLSGGDYDGDTVTIIWDERITAQFRNAKVPQLPGKAECGVVSETSYVHQIFRVTAPAQDELDKYIRKCLWFNGMSSRLGEVTKLLERLVYAEIRYMRSADALELAALAGYLVDGAKAGDLFPTSAWNKLQRRVTDRYNLVAVGAPAYSSENTRPRKMPCIDGLQCLNILDYLKFDVAEDRADQILQNYNDTYKPSTLRDIDLKRPWDDAWIRTESASGEEREACKALLKDMERQVTAIGDQWVQRIRRNEAIEARNGPTRELAHLDYKKLSRELADEIGQIKPIERPCYIYSRFKLEGAEKGKFWSQLRASCVYCVYHQRNNKMLWRLVGDELCWIKCTGVRARGERVRGVHEQTRNYMRMDLKKFKIAAELLQAEVE